MKAKPIKFVTSFILSVLTLTFSMVTFAQTITLYDQPNQNAKVVGTADLAAGIIPIYTPGGEWAKVADPRNGNVGWVKSSDIKNSKDSVVFTQQIIRDGSQQQAGSQQQPGTPPQPGYGTQQQPGLNRVQLQEYLEKVRKQQKAAQENLKEILKDMNTMFEQQLNNLNVKTRPDPTPAPTIQPAPKPVPNNAPQAAPAPTSNQTTPQPVTNTVPEVKKTN